MSYTKAESRPTRATNDPKCDLTIVCDGQMFNVHKSIASEWSEMLADVIYDLKPRKRTRPIFVLEGVSPQIFRKVLDYMYTQNYSDEDLATSVTNEQKTDIFLSNPRYLLDDDVPGCEELDTPTITPSHDVSFPKDAFQTGEDGDEIDVSDTPSSEGSAISFDWQDDAKSRLKLNIMVYLAALRLQISSLTYLALKKSHSYTKRLLGEADSYTVSGLYSLLFWMLNEVESSDVEAALVDLWVGSLARFRADSLQAPALRILVSKWDIRRSRVVCESTFGGALPVNWTTAREELRAELEGSQAQSARLKTQLNRKGNQDTDEMRLEPQKSAGEETGHTAQEESELTTDCPPVSSLVREAAEREIKIKTLKMNLEVANTRIKYLEEEAQRLREDVLREKQNASSRLKGLQLMRQAQTKKITLLRATTKQMATAKNTLTAANQADQKLRAEVQRANNRSAAARAFAREEQHAVLWGKEMKVKELSASNEQLKQENEKLTKSNDDLKLVTRILRTYSDQDPGFQLIAARKSLLEAEEESRAALLSACEKYELLLSNTLAGSERFRNSATS